MSDVSDVLVSEVGQGYQVEDISPGDEITFLTPNGEASATVNEVQYMEEPFYFCCIVTINDLPRAVLKKQITSVN